MLGIIGSKQYFLPVWGKQKILISLGNQDFLFSPDTQKRQNIAVRGGARAGMTAIISHIEIRLGLLKKRFDVPEKTLRHST